MGPKSWPVWALVCSNRSILPLPLLQERWVNKTTLVDSNVFFHCALLNYPSFLLLFQSRCKEEFHWIYNSFLNLSWVVENCDKYHCSCDNTVLILAGLWHGNLDLDMKGHSLTVQPYDPLSNQTAFCMSSKTMVFFVWCILSAVSVLSGSWLWCTSARVMSAGLLHGEWLVFCGGGKSLAHQLKLL